METSTAVPTSPASFSGQPAAERETTPSSRFKFLHVQIPEEVYIHVRTAALRSRMPFKDFIAHYLAEATPYLKKPEPIGLNSNPTSTQSCG